MRAPVTNPFQILNANRADSGGAAVYQAIVSPCSSCRNFLKPDQEGASLCPRRLWIESESLKDSYLSKTGCEEGVEVEVQPRSDGESSRSEDSLRNPVFLPSQGTILVWVAALDDNQGVYGPNGDYLTPDIQHPAFDTQYIRCRPYPVTPGMNQAAFYQQGRFKEGDRLLVMDYRSYQIESGNSPALLGGTAFKVDFHTTFPQIPPREDLHVTGT